MTDDDKRLLESSYRESPASTPSFGLEVLAPVLLLTGAAYIGVQVVYGTPLARLIAAAACIISLLYRLYVWDGERRPVHITEHRRFREEAQQPSRIRAATAQDHSRLTLGKWTFSEDEWRRLGEALTYGRVTRDLLAGLDRDNGESMFPNTTGRYDEYKGELQRLGWVDEDLVVTDVAWRWLRDRGLAPPLESANVDDQR